MVHATLITVGLVPRQLSALFLRIRRQQLTQNRPPPSLLKESSSCIWKGAGQWLGRFVLVISKLPHALCTSIRTQELLECLGVSQPDTQCHYSEGPLEPSACPRTLPLGMASIVHPWKQPSDYRKMSGL